MRPNITIVSLGSRVEQVVTPEPDHQWNSIRHLEVRDDGHIAFGMQWQGDHAPKTRVVGFHRLGTTPKQVDF